MDESYTDTMKHFVAVYNKAFRQGATSMREVADRLGWPITKVYRTVYAIRQVEKRKRERILAGRLTKKAQLERSLNVNQEKPKGSVE